MSIWQHLLIALGGLAILIIAWMVVQFMARKQLPADAPDRDVLACSSCAAGGLCACGLQRPPAQTNTDQ